MVRNAIWLIEKSFIMNNNDLQEAEDNQKIRNDL